MWPTHVSGISLPCPEYFHCLYYFALFVRDLNTLIFLRMNVSEFTVVLFYALREELSIS